MSQQLSKQETIAMRDQYIGKSCQLFFRQNPLKIIRASGQYMYDEMGNCYLDCINNVAHVGHCNPAVVEAGCRQMATLNTNNRFLHDEIVLCAKRLISTMPAELSVCFFVNSGSEANDLAIRLAQAHTGRTDVIALEHAYHGHLTTLIDISHYKFNRQNGGARQLNHVHVAPCPDIYRGKYRVGVDDDATEMTLAKKYAQDVQALCTKAADNGGVGAFIAESLLSCGGQIIPPAGYLDEVYQCIRAAGGVCIADEVQVGFGRVGSHWWAFQAQGVCPDIVTMGKPMGNGHPVAAVITTAAIAESFRCTGLEYFNTYGGNPVSCAIANAVFDVIEADGLMRQAQLVGGYLLDNCRRLALKHPTVIGDVRGVGLFVGVELVMDRQRRVPDAELAKYVVTRMYEERILVSSDGPDNNVIKLKPPMVFTQFNVDQLVQTLDVVLTEHRNKTVVVNVQSTSVTTINAADVMELPCKAEEPRPSMKLTKQIKSI